MRPKALGSRHHGLDHLQMLAQSGQGRCGETFKLCVLPGFAFAGKQPDRLLMRGELVLDIDIVEVSSGESLQACHLF
jgi:hypothetical protein